MRNLNVHAWRARHSEGPGYGEPFDFDSSTITATIRAAMGLDTVPYPYPSGSWNNYIYYAKTNGNNSNAGANRVAILQRVLFAPCVARRAATHAKTRHVHARRPRQANGGPRDGGRLLLLFISHLDLVANRKHTPEGIARPRLDQAVPHDFSSQLVLNRFVH